MQYSKTPVFFDSTSYLFGKESKCKTCYYTPSKGYLEKRPDDCMITLTIYTEPNTYWEYSMNNKNGIYKLVDRKDWIKVK